MAKYDPLFEHLCRAGDGPLELPFETIDTLVGGLPVSAVTHSAWWANEVDGRHVQARSWTNAGRTVERVDFARRVVRLSAARWNRGA